MQSFMFIIEVCRNKEIFKLLVDFLKQESLYKNSLKLISELLTFSDDDLDIEHNFITQDILVELEKLKNSDDTSVKVHILAILYNLTAEHIENCDYYCNEELILHAVDMVNHHNNSVK